MADPKLEFTTVTRLQPEAFGEPGKRTFRIVVESEGDSAVLWLENTQLFQLALAVAQLLATAPKAEPTTDVGSKGEIRSSTNLEFRVGRFVLGLTGMTGRFLIDVHDIEDEEDSPPTLRLWGNEGQFMDFVEKALEVCAAGRPICPLCYQPLDPDGHKCSRTNGHSPHDLIDLEVVE